MSDRDDSVFLGHMLDIARKAVGKATGISRAEFDADEDRRIVIAHFLQVIGEAAKRVSLETRRSHPDIPWAEIIGMRHRLVHDYLDVDYDIVWDVARHQLPSLIPKLDSLVPPEEP